MELHDEKTTWSMTDGYHLYYSSAAQSWIISDSIGGANVNLARVDINPGSCPPEQEWYFWSGTELVFDKTLAVSCVD